MKLGIHRWRLGSVITEKPSTARSRWGITALSCRWFLVLLWALAPGSSGFAQNLFVSESLTELTSSADLDGDGREDLVIVDRVSGSYRIGYQLTAGNYAWAPTRASGVSHVSGFGLGAVVSTTRSGLAFTAPDANRVNLLDASTPTTAGTPVSVFIPSVGPSAVGVIDVGGGGNTAYEDFVIGSVLNGAISYRSSIMRNTNGTNFGLLLDSPLLAPMARVNRTIARSTYPGLLGVVSRTAPTNDLSLLEFTSGVATLKAIATNLPAGADYVHARFSGTLLSQFLFYVPGGTNLELRPINEVPALSGNFSFGTAVAFTYTQALRQVFVLPGPLTNRLLLIFGSGASAGIYNFNGASAPILVTNLTAPPGESITGAAQIGNNGVMLLSGVGGVSSSFHQYTAVGGGYNLSASGALPAITPYSGGANVFQFQTEPFVTAPATLLRSLNAGDWSSKFTLVAGNAGATAERFGGTSNGLGNPVLTSLGKAHPSAGFGLVNQYGIPISLFGLTPAAGDQVAEVMISPEPGSYRTSQQISFNATPAGNQVWYRQSVAAAWTLYAAPFWIYTNTTIFYYAKTPAGISNSLLRTAVYTFTDATGVRDSDGDGVPDFVELAKGLDPTAGADSDGDGWSDKDELVRHTDPNDATSHPPLGTPRLEDRNAFDYVPTLRPWDGTLNTNSLSATGALVRAYDMQGSLLGFGIATNLFTAGITNPSGYMTNLVFDPLQRLFVSGTEPHYDIITLSTDRTIGREVFRLTAFPAITPVTVSYGYGGSNLLTEAQNWILTASNAYAAVPHVQSRRDITIFDTLTALVFERGVGQILLNRGTNWGTNITLFSYRSGDLGRSNVSSELLLSLERTTNGFPGYLLAPMFERLNSAVRTNTDAATLGLRAVTAEIYRISSASNNAAPSVYGSPVEAVRHFLATCTVESNYAAVFTLSASVRSNACVGVSNLVALAMPRPTTNIALKVRADTFANSFCIKLETPAFAVIKYLIDADGHPYSFPSAFSMIAGTEVQVLGYTDVTNTACAGDAIEVITISMTGIPIASDPDLDGDLLLDSWELLFLDGLGSDAFADYDGDGYQNVQEMFEGSDPSDFFGLPSVLPVAMARPTILITVDGLGNVRLQWNFAFQYANNFIFSIREAASIAGPFTNVLLDVPHAGGVFDVTLPPAGPSHFYYVTMSLRPL
ncbi:MAG: hypothetical protein QOF48_641 [Verrucomicrobiota bacterium]